MVWPAQRGQPGIVQHAGLLARRATAGRRVGRSSRPIDVQQRALARAGGADQRAELAAAQHAGRCRAAPRPRSAGRCCRTSARPPGAAPRRAASATDRLHRVEPRGAQRRHRRRRARRSASPAPRPRRTARARAPAGTARVPSALRARACQKNSAPAAERRADERAEQPQHAALDQEDAQHLAAPRPMARRMPISCERWMTETTSTLAMPKATDRPTKQPDEPCWRRAAR